MNAFLIALLLSASQPPRLGGGGEEGVRDDGDCPLTNYLSLVGPYGVTYSTIDSSGDDPFVLTDIPPGATVARALVITETWDWGAETHTIHLTIDGTDYGTITAETVDVHGSGEEVFDLATYIIDVSAQITGNGQFLPSITANQPASGPYASLLWVVYERPDLPSQEIHLNVGGEALRYSYSFSLFTVAGSGKGTLHIFQEAGDYDGSEGTESVEFNNQLIACCQIFDGSESYLKYPVNALTGWNAVRLTTGEDWLGWHVVALELPLGPTSVSESSWGFIKALYR